MTIRPSTIYLGMTGLLLLILTGVFLSASAAVGKSQPLFLHKISLVRQLELTDLCIFNEASYTRHLSMADLSTPFQDAPMSLEHFPSGGLVEPPLHLTRIHGKHY